MGGSLSRTILVLGGVVFGTFFIAALVMRQTGVSESTISIVGGVMAYGFIVLAAVAWLRHRSRRARPDEAAAAFLRRHPGVERVVGRPVEVSPAAPGSPSGPVKGAGQASVLMVCRGSHGEAHADVVMARIRRGWEVLQAELLVDGDRVPLTRSTPAG